MQKPLRRLLLLFLVLLVPTMVFAAGAQKKAVTVVLDSEPPHLDNHSYTGLISRWASDPVNGFLFNFSPDMKVVPELIKEYEWSDAKTFKFKLKEGAKFHNGREVVAEDVKNRPLPDRVWVAPRCSG